MGAVRDLLTKRPRNPTRVHLEDSPVRINTPEGTVTHLRIRQERRRLIIMARILCVILLLGIIFAVIIR